MGDAAWTRRALVFVTHLSAISGRLHVHAEGLGDRTDIWTDHLGPLSVVIIEIGTDLLAIEPKVDIRSLFKGRQGGGLLHR